MKSVLTVQIIAMKSQFYLNLTHHRVLTSYQLSNSANYENYFLLKSLSFIKKEIRKKNSIVFPQTALNESKPFQLSNLLKLSHYQR